RSGLVIAEVGLACVLLVGAGLLLRSFVRVLDLDLGFQPEGAAAIKMLYNDIAPNENASAAKRGAAFRAAIEKVEALPGVESAGIVDYLPLGANRAWGSLIPPGRTYTKDLHPPAPLVYVTSPGYLRAMGMRVHGRDFDWSDGMDRPGVIIINAAAAKFYWPGEDAVGKVLTGNGDRLTVIGVVDDAHVSSIE